ncbi:MAG TPA: phosphoribosylformylglycinamidine cyclo-ligase [Vicinamibacteria bacterium]|nr:phosphoribosylformylglycinamidine cyclo-ligase [Vicinamibacteria bacterium]
MDYRSAGVDIDAATKALSKVREHARSTYRPGVLSDIGSFGGLFRLDSDRYRKPVLVASTDGVGTKLKIAFATGRHDTCGYDLVAHCVNDILVQGARPLFFLDYVAMGRLDGEVLGSIVSGMAEACREHGVALLGGETAEMPGLYAPGEYDVAGTIVGVVEEDHIIDGSRVAVGDVLLALESWGLHTNGYSLARKILFEREGLVPESHVEALRGSVADVLLAKHRCYMPELEPFLDGGEIHALAHITGGGLTDNIPRVLPEGCGVRIDLGTLKPQPIFRYLMDKGGVPQKEMLRTFNLGVGMVVIADKAGLPLPGAWPIGEVVSGQGVRYEGSI